MYGIIRSIEYTRDKWGQLWMKRLELLQVLEETRNITKAAENSTLLSRLIKTHPHNWASGVGVIAAISSGIRFTPFGETVLFYTVQQQKNWNWCEKSWIRCTKVFGTWMQDLSKLCLVSVSDAMAEYHRTYPNVNLITDQSRNLIIRCWRKLMAVIRGEYVWDGMQFLLGQENVCVICSRELENTPLNEYQYMPKRTLLWRPWRCGGWMRTGLGLRAIAFVWIPLLLVSRW